MRLTGSITHRIEHETDDGLVISEWLVPYSARFKNHQLDEIEADGRSELLELWEVVDGDPKEIPIDDVTKWEIAFDKETKGEDFTDRFSANAMEEYWSRRM